jgi:hypothetical protein
MHHPYGKRTTRDLKRCGLDVSLSELGVLEAEVFHTLVFSLRVCDFSFAFVCGSRVVPSVEYFIKFWLSSLPVTTAGGLGMKHCVRLKDHETYCFPASVRHVKAVD